MSMFNYFTMPVQEGDVIEWRYSQGFGSLTFIDFFVLLEAVFFDEFAGLAGFFEAAYLPGFF